MRKLKIIGNKISTLLFENKQMNTNLIFRFLTPYFKKHITSLIIGGISVFLLSILILPTPLITRHIIDKTLPNKNLQELLFLILLVLGLLIFMKVVGYFQGLLFYKINTKVILSIRLDLLEKINKLPLKINKKYGTGYLISRINDDTDRIRTLFADTVIMIIKDILTFLVGVMAIFIIHWKLALISITILPFFVASTIYFSKIIRKLSKVFYEDNAQTTRQLEESLNMVELIKVFLKYKYNLLRYIKRAKQAFRSNIKLGKTSFLNSTVTGFLGGLAPIVIIGYGGYEIIQGNLTLGSLIAFNSFVGYLFGPTSRLINVNIQIQKSLMALERVRELFDLPEERIDKEIVLPEKIEQLAFGNVHFSYEKRVATEAQRHREEDINGIKFKNLKDKNLITNKIVEEEILKGISFTARNGEKIGIVGSSGGGKTTLLRLLAGLYEIDEGDIILNGRRLVTSELIALRRQVAIVEQEPYLFNDTIYNNIKFGNGRASEEEIYLSAKQAYADEFIKQLPIGYKTIVGEKGANLSVGQKQRIAIARALIRNPKILILDEATSNIDPISESFINKTIINLPEDMIIFVITHHLTITRKCNKILVLDNGRIIEQGTHNELIKMNNNYKKLYDYKF
ncbi:MAG: ABC transporter ATP-binding protein [Candidatus Cloacimonadota bacterium]|nr:ABC transporter ATP-binding protein [Candidatus Cloacimonadota bacterium]